MMNKDISMIIDRNEQKLQYSENCYLFKLLFEWENGIKHKNIIHWINLIKNWGKNDLN